jgi:hypothetical protein
VAGCAVRVKKVWEEFTCRRGGERGEREGMRLGEKKRIRMGKAVEFFGGGPGALG